MTKRNLFALLGLTACVMALFPPVHTYRGPVVMEDRGIAWQMRGGPPNLVVADPGGFRNERFAFLLSLGQNDKIRTNQLVVQLLVLGMIGFGIWGWKPGLVVWGNPVRPRDT